MRTPASGKRAAPWEIHTLPLKDSQYTIYRGSIDTKWIGLFDTSHPNWATSFKFHTPPVKDLRNI